MKAKILFYLKRSKSDKLSGMTPIYLRITVDGRRQEISTGSVINPNEWDPILHRAKGKKASHQSININLASFESKATTIISDLRLNEKPITAVTIKERLTGKIKNHTLLDACDFTLNRIQALVGSSYTESTYEKYRYTKMRVVEYMKNQLNQKDILLEELNYGFLSGFDTYMKTKNKIAHNSAVKYIKNLKSIVTEAKRNGWIKWNPFDDYPCSYIITDKPHLTWEEIRTIENVNLPTEGLMFVRDAFVFAIYTGFAFIDVKKLTNLNISIRNDGKKWIVIKRQKTGTRAPVRLLPKADEIINKYKNNPYCIETNKVMPLYSHHTVNKYLKEIANLCGINKTLTFHIARHTYATTVTLSSGMPITSVMEAMGHKNIAQTLEYAKTSDLTLSHDFDELEKKLKNNQIAPKWKINSN